MALSDFESYIRSRLLEWSPSLDVTSGSPIDQKVVQPLLRRVGTDPFTVDAYTFIITRLSEAFPDLAIGNGDAIEDLVIKAVLLLWDPLIREIERVKASRSFASPSLLTVEEAEELGSTFFVPRDTGDTARGPARIYFAQPQQQTVTASNFVTSKGGLVFYPTGQQSIQATEMALNKEEDLYYFDINVVAAEPGDQYNIEPKELTSIANIAAAVRVSNKVRFRDGRPAEDAETYVARLERGMSEKSMVSNRGIAAVVGEVLPEVSRLAVVGYQDPEMNRDVLKGGGLGPALVVGVDGEVPPDGRFAARSRRLRSPSADFFSIAGMGPVSGLVLTVMGGLGPGASPAIQDLEVTRIVSASELEVADPVLVLGSVGIPFTVRRRELTLSGIPGGILRPNGPNGTVTTPDGQVHVGGCVDMYASSLSLSSGTLEIDTVADEAPEFFGSQASVPSVLPGDPTWLQLNDLVLGTNYQLGDRTHTHLSQAVVEQYVLQVLDGVVAGSYRILAVELGSLGDSPLLRLDPAPLAVSSTLRFKWRLVTDIDFDLAEVKEVRVRGATGSGSQNRDTFTTQPATDFGVLGVSVGDVLRLEVGPAAGDYEVVEVVAPTDTTLRLNRKFPASFSGTKYMVFRPNDQVGAQLPVIRVTSAELLDTSGQPLGIRVPHALPVGAVCRGFSNVGSGIKASTPSASLGLVSREHVIAGTNFGAGETLVLEDDRGVSISVTFTGVRSVAQMASDINAAAVANGYIGYAIAHVAAASPTTQRIRITAFGPNTRTGAASDANALQLFFGDQQLHTSRDIRDITAAPTAWGAVVPGIDAGIDVVRVVDGLNLGFHRMVAVSPVATPPFATGEVLRLDRDLAPDFAVPVQVGSRSFGGARLLYLEPTTAEIGPGTTFSATAESGGTVSFFPDVTVGRQVLPPLPGGEKPGDAVTSGTVLTSNSSDFLRHVRVGDLLELDFVPVTGTVALADPVPLTALKDLFILVSDTQEKTITFVSDVGTPGAVSRDGIAAQLNSNLGMEIASIEELTPGNFYLKLTSEVPIRIRRTGSANTALGFSTITDTPNTSPHAGAYRIEAVDITTVAVSPAFPPGTVSEGQFRVRRVGVQRITSTEMAKNIGVTGLYYWDVELFSEGPGDAWNLPVGVPMEFEGVKGDGYALRTEDPNTSFSSLESVRMTVSRFVLPEGVDDSPLNAVQIPGQALRVNYEYSEVISTLQGVASSDTERPINASPLARHLLPHFVRCDVEYVGGSSESEILPELETLVRNTLPSDPLEASELQGVVLGRGATSVKNPLDIVAIVHHPDRKVRMSWSQDSVTTGRLAAFIPDRIKLTRRAR